MAVLFDPYFQAISADGIPFSGAKLYFYRAGTTSLVTVYSDAGGSTPRTNPVIASSAGLFPPIYLSTTVPLKYILKDADGVTIQTVDRFEPVGAGVTGNSYTVGQASDLPVPSNEYAEGIVLDDPDPSKNGYWYRSGGAWVFGRPFPDGFAKVGNWGGSANAQTAMVLNGDTPTVVQLFFGVVAVENTGAMTLDLGAGAKAVVSAAGTPLTAGAWTGAVQFFLNDDGQYQLVNDAGAAASAAASAANAAASESNAAESEAAAAQSAADAEEAAASVNLPIIQPGDAGKTLIVKGDESGYEFSGPVDSYYSTRAEIKALDTASVQTVYLTEAGREGVFEWRTGDYSAEITADPLEGIYIKADAIASTLGAWVRVFNNEYYVKWFGAKEDGTTDDAASIQAAVNLSLSDIPASRPIPLVLTGSCNVESPIIVNRPVATASGAETFVIRGAGPFAGFTSAISGAIIDSDLPFLPPFEIDPPSCNIRFEGVTFLGAGNATTTCVSDKFVKVHFEACRFNVIKCVVASHYLQSWHWHFCSMIAWPGWFCSAVLMYYDCHWDECDFESGASGIKSFESGFYSSSITKCIFENSVRFFAQANGFGTVITGNYTEANSEPDYQFADAAVFGSHRGTVFNGNFMGLLAHTNHNVIIGNCEGMLAGGNWTDGKLYDTSNTTPGSFKSLGDYAGISKFSHPGSFDMNGAGNYAENSRSSVSATSLTTGTAKTITSITIPAGDWDLSGVVGFTPGASTSVTRYISSISLTDNAIGSEGSATTDVFAAFVSGGFIVNYPTPVVRMSLATATTVYLVALADFSVAGMTSFGRIRARRAGGG